MKRLLIILTAIVFTVSVFAQPPEKMSYQAVIRDANNNLLPNQPVGMQISIMQESPDGAAVYVETQTPTTNENGLVSIEVGTGMVVSGGFANVDWAKGPYFIKTEADPTGGTDYTITGTSQLLSVPYALHAKTAERITGDNALENKVAAMENILISLGLYTVTDIDSNNYNMVIIGKQIWMEENLRVTRYNDGEQIELVTDGTEWRYQNKPAYCWYDNDSTANAKLYGALYNWHTVNTGKLCPFGWHVPSEEEWITLFEYLGGDTIAGSKLKETGNIHWTTANTDATNESKFTALPGGYRAVDGNFYHLGFKGHWWSSTSSSDTHAIKVDVNAENGVINSGGGNKSMGGVSVRCIKD
ncbi:FISUMP domain-containing protein [Saccharicrinis sp. FJH2]|uniref:fibrobacter succinogenes major paralogous domain-containing protein n=1 Tax=Saccharicrinis sp. FJH65 TaxID=3344659 RepID=UPI0035F35843